MNRMIDWMRVGLRDLRGDLRRFGIVIACLALGTSVIAAVGSVGTTLKTVVEREAVHLMGGDLEASRPDRAATAEELAFLESLGRVAHVIDTNVRASVEGNNAFVDLRAVNGNYPLAGNVESPQLAPGEKPGALLAERDGVYGAIVDAVLFDRLGIGIGGHFHIGATEFEVRGTLTSLPDSAVRGFKLGLTMLISIEAFGEMTDLRPPLPGLLTQHRYKIALEGMDYTEAAAGIADRFEEPGWQVRSPRDAAGALVRYYDLFLRYLLVVGLSSLLVGGIGVFNGVAAHIGERQRTIAILRSLGATGARIVTHFLAQIAVLAGIGIGLGVLMGAVASLFLLPLVGQALNVDLPPAIAPLPLATAAVFGSLVAFVFAYGPLMQARDTSPALLFRSLGTIVLQPDWRTMPGAGVAMPLLVAVAAIVVLAIATTGDPALVGYYALGVAVSAITLRVAAWLLRAGLRKVPAVRNRSLRNALRNIRSPGSTAPVVIVSIGLGMAMLMVVVLLQANLQSQLLGAILRDAPTFVVTDLFDDEVATIEELAVHEEALTGFEWTPMLRGAVVSVKGRDPSRYDNLSEEASLLLSGDTPLTWRRELPAGSEIVAGAWWPPDYDGPPLISVHDTMKAELGLEIGDVITFELFGDTIEATVANFRDYQWQRGLNFTVSFSPGAIESYPATFLGAIKAAPGREKDVERLLARTFPEVSFIPIGQALEQLAGVFGQLGTAVTLVGSLAAANGLLVLTGTLAAGRKQREADAVVHKVLGATRGDVLRVFIVEYGLLGGFAAVLAAFLGTLGAWAITSNALGIGFAPSPLLVLGVILGGIAATVGAGAILTVRVLSTPPARFLRNNQ